MEENSFCPKFGLDVKNSDFVAIQKIKHQIQEISRIIIATTDWSV